MNTYHMTYRQLLNKFKDVPAYKLLVADAVQDILIDSKVAELNDEQYESVCDYVYDYVMNSEMDVNVLVDLIHDAKLQGLPIIDLILAGNYEDADEIIYARM